MSGGSGTRFLPLFAGPDSDRSAHSGAWTTEPFAWVLGREEVPRNLWNGITEFRFRLFRLRNFRLYRNAENMREGMCGMARLIELVVRRNLRTGVEGSWAASQLPDRANYGRFAPDSATFEGPASATWRCSASDYFGFFGSRTSLWHTRRGRRLQSLGRRGKPNLHAK
jgi:hypothetical protein